MFHASMATTIAEARTLARMDELARRLWQAHASGALDDDEAQGLAEALHERRKAVREAVVPVGVPPGRASLFAPRTYQRSPNRALSRYRRRQLAASGPMPPALASRFTTGQLAVLRIIGDEIARTGACALCIDAIAARAGVCRRLAQTALRLAEGDGLLTVEERRREGAKNLTNVVRLLSREWLAWLRRGSRKPPALMPLGKAARSARADRVQKNAPHGQQVLRSLGMRPAEPSQLPPGGGRRLG